MYICNTVARNSVKFFYILEISQQLKDGSLENCHGLSLNLSKKNIVYKFCKIVQAAN